MTRQQTLFFLHGWQPLCFSGTLPATTTSAETTTVLSCPCGYTGETLRDLRHHRRERLCSHYREEQVADDVDRQITDVKDSLSSSAPVPPDIKSPSSRIDPEQHHSVEAKHDCHPPLTHGKAKSPTDLNGRKPRLKLPCNAEDWKKIDDELKIALPRVFPKSKIRRLSCSEAILKFENYLYNFIAERVPQKASQNQREFKTKAITRLKTAISQNRLQKNLHKKHVAALRKAGCFSGNLAKEESRLWRRLLKTGNRLRVRLKEATNHAELRRANARFRADPHSFVKRLFKPKSNDNAKFPTKERCEQYFPTLYKDADRSSTYVPLPEMHRPQKPTTPFVLDPPSKYEFRRAVFSKRNAASPGRNGINYLVFKKLSAAFNFLYTLVRKAWDGDLPESWAQAAVILLFKDGDPLDPANYRPIALQSCSGKSFFSIWAKRLEQFMISNAYFQRSKQKGFLQGIAGCSEHVAALKAALRDAKSSYRQIIVAWIDLKNAFGSVSHNLIQFALNWYHVPDQLAQIILTYYDMLCASIETKNWSSKCFVYEIGVFQGCVISPLLFNMVFNLLLELLSALTEEVGYKFKGAQVTLHDLAYADDLTLLSRTTAKAQHSLAVVDRFLDWTRTMAAKPSKCRSLAFKYWTPADANGGRKRLLDHAYAPFDPELKIGGQLIRFISQDCFKFLGWKVYHHMRETDQKQEVHDMFVSRMELIDKTILQGFMKLWLYQHYVVAYLAWPFMVYDFDVS